MNRLPNIRGPIPAPDFGRQFTLDCLLEERFAGGLLTALTAPIKLTHTHERLPKGGTRRVDWASDAAAAGAGALREVLWLS